jgi:hypothetical protein
MSIWFIIIKISFSGKEVVIGIITFYELNAHLQKYS